MEIKIEDWMQRGKTQFCFVFISHFGMPWKDLDVNSHNRKSKHLMKKHYKTICYHSNSHSQSLKTKFVSLFLEINVLFPCSFSLC